MEDINLTISDLGEWVDTGLTASEASVLGTATSISEGSQGSTEAKQWEKEQKFMVLISSICRSHG